MRQRFGPVADKALLDALPARNVVQLHHHQVRRVICRRAANEYA